MRVVQAKFQKNKVVRERYIIDDLLGQGGSGAVYRVRDRRVKGNVFALKEVIEPTSHQRERFAFESTILRRLDHYSLPHVYRVFEDQQNCRVYMLMDYIEGPDLEQLRLQQPACRFSFTQAIRIMRPIVEAVLYLHAQLPPIIHRDIKPANIIVPTSGEAAVLVDFGIAKEYNRDSTTTVVRHCSPGYGAPEQYMHGTNVQTDMYGLAATFYTLLTGQVPIDALYRMTRMSARGADPLELASSQVPTISIQVAEVLQHALAIDRGDRFTSVAEFWTALQDCSEDLLDPSATGSAVLTAVTTAQAAPPMICETPLLPDISSANATPLPDISRANATPVIQQWPLPHMRSIKPLAYTKSLYSRCVPPGMLAIILVALLSGALFGTNLWSHPHHTQEQRTFTPTHNIHDTQNGTRSRHITAHVSSTIPAPALSPIPTTKLESPLYPQLALTYNGSIHNTPTSIDTIMALSRIQQHGRTINGYVYAAQGLIENSHFIGNVSTNNLLEFSITSTDTLLPLSFTGHIQSDGTIRGTYCSTQNGLCNYHTGGYGSWEVYS